MESKLIKTINESLQSLVQEFRASPFDYLYESDIRCMLFAKLFEKMSASKVEIKSRGGGKFDLIDKQHEIINPVKSEYPSGTRFDIAIIEGPGDGARSIWNQGVRVAIEIKLWQIDGTGGGVRQDLAKMTDYRLSGHGGEPFLGLSLLFCHPKTEYQKYLNEYLSSLKPVSGLDTKDTGLSLHIISQEHGWQAGWVDHLHPR